MRMLLHDEESQESPGEKSAGQEGQKEEVVPPSTIAVPTPENIARAAGLLREGRLVVFPTETVYGLGADATNDKAVAAIYAAKGRPRFNPLIIHLWESKDAAALVEWNDQAEFLSRKFWPGPLTFILPRRPDCPVSLLASAGLDTLAVRIPSHPTAKELLRVVGLPIAAPSANAFGKISPTTPEHVVESLGGNIDMVLDGGRCPVGVESTVIDLTTSPLELLRHGGVTRERLEEALGKAIKIPGDAEAPKSPGMLRSHYAPNIPLRLNATKAASDEALLTFGPDAHIEGGALRLNLSPTGDLTEAAANLFTMLRRLDQPHLSGIAATPIPETGLGAAIADRLLKASTPTPKKP